MLEVHYVILVCLSNFNFLTEAQRWTGLRPKLGHYLKFEAISARSTVFSLVCFYQSGFHLALNPVYMCELISSLHCIECHSFKNGI